MMKTTKTEKEEENIPIIIWAGRGDFKILAKELGNRGGTGRDNRKVRMLLSSLFEMGWQGDGGGGDRYKSDPLYKLIGEIGIHLTFNNLGITRRIKIKAQLSSLSKKRQNFSKKKHSK